MSSANNFELFFVEWQDVWPRETHEDNCFHWGMCRLTMTSTFFLKNKMLYRFPKHLHLHTWIYDSNLCFAFQINRNYWVTVQLKLLPQRSLTTSSCKDVGCQKKPQRWQARWWRPTAGWTTRWRRYPAGYTPSCQRGWRRAPSWSQKADEIFSKVEIKRPEQMWVLHFLALSGL